jgi:hypothetical protein
MIPSGKRTFSIPVQGRAELDIRKLTIAFINVVHAVVAHRGRQGFRPTKLYGSEVRNLPMFYLDLQLALVYGLAGPINGLVKIKREGRVCCIMEGMGDRSSRIRIGMM